MAAYAAPSSALALALPNHFPGVKGSAFLNPFPFPFLHPRPRWLCRTKKLPPCQGVFGWGSSKLQDNEKDSKAEEGLEIDMKKAQRLANVSRPQGGRVKPKDNKLIFVAGATGKVGSRTVRELLKLGFRVRATARNVEKAQVLFQEFLEETSEGEASRSSSPFGNLFPANLFGFLNSSQNNMRMEFVECDLEESESIGEALGNASVVVCCIGASEKEIFDVTGPYRVDYKATENLIKAASIAEVKKFVLLSSLGTRKFGLPAGVLNLFWGVLIWKRKAEEALINSGLQYTIVRPGGMERPPDNYKETHNLVLAEADTRFGGQVSKLQVAELIACIVENPQISRNKVVEVVAETTAPLRPIEDLLQEIQAEEDEVASPKSLPKFPREVPKQAKQDEGKRREVPGEERERKKKQMLRVKYESEIAMAQQKEEEARELAEAAMAEKEEVQSKAAELRVKAQEAALAAQRAKALQEAVVAAARNGQVLSDLQKRGIMSSVTLGSKDETKSSGKALPSANKGFLSSQNGATFAVTKQRTESALLTDIPDEKEITDVKVEKLRKEERKENKVGVKDNVDTENGGIEKIEEIPDDKESVTGSQMEKPKETAVAKKKDKSPKAFGWFWQEETDEIQDDKSVTDESSLPVENEDLPLSPTPLSTSTKSPDLKPPSSPEIKSENIIQGRDKGITDITTVAESEMQSREQGLQSKNEIEQVDAEASQGFSEEIVDEVGSREKQELEEKKTAKAFVWPWQKPNEEKSDSSSISELDSFPPQADTVQNVSKKEQEVQVSPPNSRPLSPYTMYKDLKPPPSPIPSPSKPNSTKVEKINDMVKGTTIFLESKTEDAASRDDPKSRTSKESIEDAEKEERRKVLAAQQVLEAEMRASEAVVKAKEALDFRWPWEKSTSSEPVLGLPMTSEKEITSKLLESPSSSTPASKSLEFPSSTFLSPYPRYKDLKPPASPIPRPSKPNSAKVEKINDMEEETTNFVESKTEDATSTDDPKSSTSKEAVEDAEKQEKLKALATQQVLEVEMRESEAVAKAKAALALRWPWEKSTSSEPVLGLPMTSEKETTTSKLSESPLLSTPASKSLELPPTVLSPYPRYKDLKPPASPIPRPSKPNSAKVEKINDMEEETTNFVESKSEDTTSTDDPKSSKSKEAVEDTEKEERLKALAAQQVLEAEMRESETVAKAKAALAFRWPWEKSTSSEPVLGLPMTSGKETTTSKLLESSSLSTATSKSLELPPSTVLSPYPRYKDLKPPTSPIPKPSIPSSDSGMENRVYKSNISETVEDAENKEVAEAETREAEAVTNIAK